TTYLVGGRNGVIKGCLQNPTALLRCEIPNRVSFVSRGNFNTTLVEPVSKKQVHLVVVENAENQLVYNTFSYAPKHLVVNNNSIGTKVINLGADQVGGTGVGVGAAMLVMNGGSMKVINPMRVYGHSYDFTSGKLTIYNRTTIWEGGEGPVNESK
ncbi:MAG: hypothetical protein IIX22_07420, partial [Ruminococcus sp.]|nr:hypothetical protein [Ruminococcus sp.]